MSVHHCVKYSPAEYGEQGNSLFQGLVSQLGHLELHGCWSHLKAWLIISNAGGGKQNTKKTPNSSLSLLPASERMFVL